MSNCEKIDFKRTVPIRQNVDVFVAGGGPSGVAAAVAAARHGCRVYLAEGQACLGGAGTAGLVPAFMTFSDGVNFLASGIGEEIYNRLRDAGGTGPVNRFSIRVEVLKRVYDTLMIESGADFTFHTQLIGVEAKGGEVSSVILAAKSGIFGVRARIYIDCTGDGDLAVWAGAPCEKGDEMSNMMPGTLCSLWAGIDWKKVAEERKRKKTGANMYVEQAYNEGILSVKDKHIPGMWHVGEIMGGGNIGHAFGVDGTDEVSLTKAIVEQRKILPEYGRYYKKYFEGYEDMELVSTGSILGIRETRRIMGDYVLNLEDFKNRAVFDDEIGRYCYPVDIHPSRPDAADYAKFEEEYFKTFRYAKGESYGIPYRSLVPGNLSNVLVAGRCISSDRYIQGSVRVMPGCYITGQAAGVAAAIAAKQNTDTRGFSVGTLQDKLREMGAYVHRYGTK